MLVFFHDNGLFVEIYLKSTGLFKILHYSCNSRLKIDGCAEIILNLFGKHPFSSVPYGENGLENKRKQNEMKLMVGI